MSYSFNITAPSKAAAVMAVAAKYAEMASKQAIHVRDFSAALANATSVIGLLEDDERKHVSVSCNGYVSWGGALRDDSRNPLHAASVAASASLIEPPQDKDPA